MAGNDGGNQRGIRWGYPSPAKWSAPVAAKSRRIWEQSNVDEVVRYLQGAIDEASLVRLGSLPVRLGVVGISTAWTANHGQNQALNERRTLAGVGDDHSGTS